MDTEPILMEKPSPEDVKNAVERYFSSDESSQPIRESAKIIKTDHETEQKINSLSGRCVAQTTSLQEFLDQDGIYTIIVKSKNQGEHTFLICDTSKGEIIIDATVGMFVVYPQIFVGTLAELRKIFLDSEREFLAGKRLWSIEHDITTREEWFNILYTY